LTVALRLYRSVTKKLFDQAGELLGSYSGAELRRLIRRDLQIGSDDPDVAIERRLKGGVLIDAYDLAAADHVYFAKFEIEARRSAATSARRSRSNVGGGPKPATHTRPKPRG
jgi:hypothetical protein